MQQAYFKAGQMESADTKVLKGKCAMCGTTRTPQWREGPDGPKTLCNACGVRLSREKKNGRKTVRKKNARNFGLRYQLEGISRYQSDTDVTGLSANETTSEQPSTPLPVADFSSKDIATDVSDSLGQDITAAVQLLSMSHSTIRGVPTDLDRDRELPDFEFMTGTQAWRLLHCNSMSGIGNGLSDPIKNELWAVHSQLQTARWEVEAAEAAVAAVGEVLAARTAAAVDAQLRFKALQKSWEELASKTKREDEPPLKKSKFGLSSHDPNEC